MGAGIFGVFLFLTYFMQQTLSFSPLVSGLAFLPMVAMIMPAGAIGQTRLLPRFGPRPLVAAGMLLSAAAMVMLTGVSVHSSHGKRAAGRLVIGVGLGLIFAPAMDTATRPASTVPRRCGLRAGQHRTAGRRLDRHRSVEHAGDQRGGDLRLGPPRRR